MTLGEQRFVALCKSLVAQGLLGDAGPLAGLDYAPPAAAAPTFRAGATDADRAAVQAALSAWDWAQTEDQLQQRDALQLFAATDPTSRAVRALALVINAELNKLRALAGQPTRTLGQAAADWQAAITSGAAD